MQRTSPFHYKLLFAVDLNKSRFSGQTVIAVGQKKPASQIALDSQGLSIKSVEVRQGKKIIPVRFTTGDRELILTFTDPLPKGSYQIHVSFAGALADNLTGFYRSGYIDKMGNKKFMATSQFEAQEAKRAFPCFDRPDLKATFDVRFIIDAKLEAVSNTLPVGTKRLPDGKKEVTFKTTPKMSTYLLYLGVGEFEFWKERRNKTLIRVVTTPGKSEYGRFAGEFADKCLRFFEDYFNYKYPLEKLDLIAVPDFAAGAMENWGAITFRENVLLYYPGKSSVHTKQFIAQVVAHEVAHMWFGNLVTMKWWEDLWLNESFATFMANKAVDHFFPEWDVWTEYLTDTVFRGMALDGLKSSHPIQVVLKSAEEIDEIFDEISYDKGGSILRMLEGYLGSEKFKRGLQQYIVMFAYGNAEGKDLWEMLEAVSQAGVNTLMAKFITQVGFPQVNVSLRAGKIRVAQSRFLFDSVAREEKTLWNIPLVIQGANDSLRRSLFTKKESAIKADHEGMILVNSGYTGFYICFYEEQLLKRLGKNISLLSPRDKMGIVHDLFALLFSQKYTLKTVLLFIEKYFSNETDAHVQAYLIGKLAGVYRLTLSEKSKTLLIKYSRQVLKRLGRAPGNNEAPIETLLRNSALAALVKLDERETTAYLLDLFRRFQKGEKALPADLRLVTFSGAVWADNTNYQRIMKLYQKSEVQEEKIKYLVALAHAKNTSSLKDLLMYALSDEVRFSHILSVVHTLSQNPYAKELVLEWLFKIWDTLRKKTGGHANTLLRRILKSVIPDCGIGREKEVAIFLKTHPVAALKKTYSQVVEELWINSRFINDFRKDR
ncbi:M1 family metallopeptidase [Candidatus Roizmanbacteria bacterium]|nr:M1 family metallopeptidase [Candidatus Roizmanbacteria bacterium]